MHSVRKALDKPWVLDIDATVKPLYGKVNVLKALIANIRAALQHVKDTAEQFKSIDRWGILLRYVSDKIAPTLSPFRPPGGLPATG